MSDDTIWLVFGFRDCGQGKKHPLHVESFRIHIGPLTRDVERQLKASMMKEARTNGTKLDWIDARPKKNEPTTNGHMRWPNSYGYEHCIYMRRGYQP